jgi:hypothetical protein
MNCRETTYTQIKFELQQRERRLSGLMGREQSARRITHRRTWIGKLAIWLRRAPSNETEWLSSCLDTEQELPLQDREAAS